MDGDQSTATSAAIAQLTCPINVPLGRKTKAEIVTQDVKNTTAASGGQISIWDGTPFSGTKISESDYVSTGASQNIPLTTKGIRTPSSSTPTYNGGLAASHYVFCSNTSHLRINNRVRIEVIMKDFEPGNDIVYWTGSVWEKGVVHGVKKIDGSDGKPYIISYLIDSGNENPDHMGRMDRQPEQIEVPPHYVSSL